MSCLLEVTNSWNLFFFFFQSNQPVLFTGELSPFTYEVIEGCLLVFVTLLAAVLVLGFYKLL